MKLTQEFVFATILLVSGVAMLIAAVSPDTSSVAKMLVGAALGWFGGGAVKGKAIRKTSVVLLLALSIAVLPACSIDMISAKIVKKDLDLILPDYNTLKEAQEDQRLLPRDPDYEDMLGLSDDLKELVDVAVRGGK